jgi:hypothetical protein
MCSGFRSVFWLPAARRDDGYLLSHLHFPVSIIIRFRPRFRFRKIIIIQLYRSLLDKKDFRSFIFCNFQK